MTNRSILIIALLTFLKTSVNGYAQNNRDLNRSLSVNFGIWRGYNTITNNSDKFITNGVPMGGIGLIYEKKIKKITYGITADFADINYATQSRSDGNVDSGATVGIGSGREELAASNIVIALGLSFKLNLIRQDIYSLNLIANPRLGLHIYNEFYDDIEGNLNNRSLDLGENFYWYNSAKQNKWPVPLLKFSIENEFRVAKKSALLLNFGYQQGFIPVFTTNRTYVSKYNTPYETRETIEVKTKASNISILIGYKFYFH